MCSFPIYFRINNIKEYEDWSFNAIFILMPRTEGTKIQPVLLSNGKQRSGICLQDTYLLHEEILSLHNSTFYLKKNVYFLDNPSDTN